MMIARVRIDIHLRIPSGRANFRLRGGRETRLAIFGRFSEG
jgi:hypothetical protein